MDAGAIHVTHTPVTTRDGMGKVLEEAIVPRLPSEVVVALRLLRVRLSVNKTGAHRQRDAAPLALARRSPRGATRT